MNKNLIPAIVGLNALVDIVFGIGGLFLIQSLSSSILTNGFVASIGSLAIIVSTLFIGNNIDRVNKKRAVVWTNLLMLISLIATIICPPNEMIYFFIIADVIIGICSLIANLSLTGSYINWVAKDKLDALVSRTTVFQNVGLILGIAVAMVLIFVGGHVKIFLVISIGIYLLINVLTLNLKYLPTEDKKAVENTESASSIVRVLKELRTDHAAMAFVTINVVNILIQGVFNGLVIYFWGSVDTTFSQIELLLVAYVIGIGLAILLIKRGWLGIYKLTLILLLAVSIDFLWAPNVWNLSAIAGLLMMNTIPVLKQTSLRRLERTDASKHTAHAGVMKFLSSLAIFVCSTFLVGFLQFIGSGAIILPLITLLVIFVYFKNVKYLT
ncbi:MAG: MFS transporter [Lactobacillaceae bacterium]|jgi:MFS family permease|nr:MFS transporter [Lactobacillaceae bacterium]